MSFTGTAAGIPFVATPPERERPDAPIVLGWHLQDAPCTEAAFAAAVPPAGLDAWRRFGARGPLALFGGSAGAGIALEVATRRPDVDPAPQNARAAEVDAHPVAWLRQYLGG